MAKSPTLHPLDLAAPAIPQVDPQTDSYWRSLSYFNTYRLLVAALLFLGAVLFDDVVSFGSRDPALFLSASITYLMLGIASLIACRARQPGLDFQLSVQISADVAIIVTMMFASGGITSGLGLLLLASLAAAGLISRGRLALFHAALASLAVLFEHTYEVWFLDGSSSLYIQAGLLSTGYFATAWLAYNLAKYAVASEELAEQRGVDLANMAQVNQLVIQDMHDGVLVVDEHGVIRQFNVQAECLLGAVANLRGARMLGEYSPVLAERLQRWREKPEARPHPMRTTLSQAPISARFIPIGKNRYRGAVIFMEDLSRVQSQAQQLKLAALGRLTANIAHEIRNPLSAINHATELLQEEPGASPTHARLLCIIHDNVQRLERMVHEVLKLNWRDRAHRENFLVGDYLRTFVEQFCQIEKIADSIFKLELESGLVVNFDRSHLNQVMWNLCRNALRYCSRHDASIRLITHAGARDALKLHVMDDGPGVDEALRHQLFEPFFTTAASGTGLGLSIAREVCEANGATLDYVPSDIGAHFMISCEGA